MCLLQYRPYYYDVDVRSNVCQSFRQLSYFQDIINLREHAQQGYSTHSICLSVKSGDGGLISLERGIDFKNAMM